MLQAKGPRRNSPGPVSQTSRRYRLFLKFTEE